MKRINKFSVVHNNFFVVGLNQGFADINNAVHVFVTSGDLAGGVWELVPAHDGHSRVSISAIFLVEFAPVLQRSIAGNIIQFQGHPIPGSDGGLH